MLLQDYRAGTLSTAEMKDLCIQEVTKLVKGFQEVSHMRLYLEFLSYVLGQGKSHGRDRSRVYES